KFSICHLYLFFGLLSQLFVAATSEANESQHEQMHPQHEIEFSRNSILTAQFECYQNIMKKDRKKNAGQVCNETWDGWLCWEETEAGFTANQNCPEYYQDFNPAEMATRVCSETGHWFLHPESNKTWTNYTECSYVPTAMNQYYLVLIGHGLSLTSLLLSLGIFFNFKSLSCQRITLHKNLFFSFVLNSVITIIWFTAVIKNQELMQSNPVWCKVVNFIHLYLFGCNYFWMLCEGIYLHTLIVVAVFAEKQPLKWYYLLGWGFPIIPALIHAIARNNYYNDNCWISYETSLLYIIHGPICAALLINLFFLLNIVRVLITKLKVTHQAESSLYMKAVRATLILVPLLGIQFVLFPYKPGRYTYETYDYIITILMHYQGLLVATIFCFFNGEVQSVMRRHWNQQRIQFGNNFAGADIFRSASYVASSLTEVHRCYSIDGHTELMNGKNSYHDIETVTPTILRSENPFA
uniref:Calcitonin gene-related peptide type 1 receptor n=1 Tax=Esox lucius TaxID=8010 RepID=A0A6Q2XT57_ESOLU